MTGPKEINDDDYIHAMSQSPVEEEPIVLSGDQELILKGIRPKDMDYWQFKLYRKLLNHHVKQYLKGKNNE
jgi:hypothetical protein